MRRRRPNEQPRRLNSAAPADVDARYGLASALAERNFQRIAQEYGSGIRVADVLESSDASHFISWKEF